MPFATADKSESPLDSAWAMGEKLMSSKELMDPAHILLISRYMVLAKCGSKQVFLGFSRSRVCA